MNTLIQSTPANRFLYAFFMLSGGYFLLFSHDMSGAVIEYGLALVFDPFDQKIPYQKRPLIQQAWLIVHLVLVFSLIGIMLFR
jgi:hypothetical protein